jgi:hypothetical protein
MDNDLFKWIIGGLVAIYSAITGSLVHLTLSHQRDDSDKHAKINVELAGLDKRVALLEQKPQIDYSKYVEAQAQLTIAIANLTQAVEQIRLALGQVREDVERMERAVERFEGANA